MNNLFNSPVVSRGLPRHVYFIIFFFLLLIYLFRITKCFVKHLRGNISDKKKLNDVSMTPCHHYQVKLEYKIKALYSDRRMNESI